MAEETPLGPQALPKPCPAALGAFGVPARRWTTRADLYAQLEKGRECLETGGCSVTLAQAAEVVASPQIRNQATLGGNVSQDTRCWYYRSGWSCYRAGGNICYADTPTAINREHAILGADRCVAVSPSDTAPALIALEASLVIRSTGGERVVAAEDYFVGPGIDITRMTGLRPGELLTAIRIPGTWANATFYFEKVRDRQVWDFPLVNVASALKADGGTISAVRLAGG